MGVLGVLEKGGDPLVGDLVVFVYTHGHMGRGLGLIRRHWQNIQRSLYISMGG